MASGREQVVVAGAGPVGLLTAALLAADPRMAGADISVLDAAARKTWDESEVDLRVYALSRASQRYFERLDSWVSVSNNRAAPYEAMHVWQGKDPEGPGSIHFTAAEIGEPDLGTIVEDSLLRHVLLEALESSGVSVKFGTAISAIEPAPRGLRLTDSTGARSRADLLIGADGAASTVRELADIGWTVRDYGQTALVAHVRTQLAHQQTAWQRFGEYGPLALLPLKDGRSSIVWSVRAGDAERLAQLDDAEFERELGRASGQVLGNITLTSRRAGFPLRLAHASTYTKQSIALVGDAGHTVHPLAGQGMNLGMLDAASLAEQVGRARDGGHYIGDRYVLERFERSRRGHNVRMQAAFDVIDRFFRLGGIVSLLRAGGMLAVDSAPVIKGFLMRQALGSTGTGTI